MFILVRGMWRVGHQIIWTRGKWSWKAKNFVG